MSPQSWPSSGAITAFGFKGRETWILSQTPLHVSVSLVVGWYLTGSHDRCCTSLWQHLLCVPRKGLCVVTQRSKLGRDLVRAVFPYSTVLLHWDVQSTSPVPVCNPRSQAGLCYFVASSFFPPFIPLVSPSITPQVSWVLPFPSNSLFDINHLCVPSNTHFAKKLFSGWLQTT